MFTNVTWFEITFAPDAPLFCSSKGRLLATSYLRSVMKTSGQKANIQKRVHTHGLRHTSPLS